MRLKLLLAIASFASSSSVNTPPRVSIEYGSVIGVRYQQTDVFLAIPYASPPIGRLRFEKPIAPKPWSTPLIATKFGPACIPHARSGIDKTRNISENCLTLNIMTPSNQSPGQLLPVLLYIHGGAFEIGHALGYKEFADIYTTQGIVVVSIQYRLGVLGFGSLGSSHFPGNYGLFDQAAALNFVHRNIEKFGGDPKNVKVIGNSAGGVSAGILAIAPSTRDLISGTIELSGSPFAHWAMNARVENNTMKFASAVGCGRDNRTVEEVRECMKGVTIDAMFDGMDDIGPTEFSLNMFKFGPRIDGDFAPRSYKEMAKEARPLPLLLGCQTLEFGMFAQEPLAPSIVSIYIDKESRRAFDRKALKKDIYAAIRDYCSSNDLDSAAEDITAFYGGPTNSEKGGHHIRNASHYMEGYIRFWSDIFFTLPTRWRALEAAKRSSKAYLYLFDHYPNDMYTNDMIKGSVHASEYAYILGDQVVKFKWTAEERKLQRELQQMIVAFVKQGKPSVSNVTWPPLSLSTKTSSNEEKLPFVRISTPHWAIDKGFYSEESHFWTNRMSRYSCRFF